MSRIIPRQVEVFPAHAMKSYRGRRGTAPLIRNFWARWRWSASRPGRGNLGKEPLYPLGDRVGLESARTSGIRTPDRPAHNLVSISVGYASTKQFFIVFVGPCRKIPGQHPDLATTSGVPRNFVRKGGGFNKFS